MRIATLMIILLLPMNVWAAAFTSKASGDWSASGQTTWNEVGVPENGDTVIINNGHTITVPAGYQAIVGTSPANDTSTAAIACSNASTGTGRLIVNGALTYRGTVTYCNSEWDFGPGSVITHDSSLSGAPSTTNYSFTALAGSNTSFLNFQGSVGAGNHVIWGIASGSGNAGRIGNKNANLNNGLMTATYTDFSDIGTATILAFAPSLNTAGSVFSFTHVTLTRCGALNLGSLSTTSTFIIDWCNVQNPILSSSNSYRPIYFGAITTKVSGTRQFTNNYVGDGQVGISSGATNGMDPGFVFQNNFLYSNSSTSGSSAPLKAYGGNFPSFSGTNWQNNFLGSYLTSGTTSYPSYLPGGTLSRTYMIYGSYAGPTHTMNYHETYMQGVATTLDGWIFEPDYGGSTTVDSSVIQGNGASSTYASANYSHIVKHTLFMPGADGYGTSAQYNMSDGTACDGSTHFCPILTYENNTAQGDNTNGALSFCGVAGEGLINITNEYTSIQNNIFYSATALQGCIVGFKHPFTNSVTTADYNWIYNLTGTLYFGIGSGVYVNSPGVHDQIGNPNFVDSSRSFIKFCQQYDPSVSDWNGCIAKFSTMGKESYDPRYNISDLITWVGGGFAPQNIALSTAGSTGGLVGAFPVSGSGSAPATSGGGKRGFGLKLNLELEL